MSTNQMLVLQVMLFNGEQNQELKKAFKDIQHIFQEAVQIFSFLAVLKILLIFQLAQRMFQIQKLHQLFGQKLPETMKIKSIFTLRLVDGKFDLAGPNLIFKIK